MRVLISQMWEAITRLVNLTLSIVPSNLVDLSLDEMCTASSKGNLVDIFEGMKTTTKQKTFRINNSVNTDYDTLESIFADAVIVYHSEVLFRAMGWYQKWCLCFQCKILNMKWTTLSVPMQRSKQKLIWKFWRQRRKRMRHLWRRP